MQGLLFSMKLLEFMSKAIKLLLTELVGQCRSVNMGKAADSVFQH